MWVVFVVCRRSGAHTTENHNEAPAKIRREEGGAEMKRLRRAMVLWGRTSIPFFKSS